MALRAPQPRKARIFAKKKKNPLKTPFSWVLRFEEREDEMRKTLRNVSEKFKAPLSGRLKSILPALLKSFHRQHLCKNLSFSPWRSAGLAALFLSLCCHYRFCNRFCFLVAANFPIVAARRCRPLYCFGSQTLGGGICGLAGWLCRLWVLCYPKCSKSRDLTAIAICDSNRESQITSDLRQCEPSQKSRLFWLVV